MRALPAGLLLVVLAQADDWPEWRGRGRLGVWNESRLIESFPPEGLSVQWRRPVTAGYSGPAVANGRVFLTGFQGEREQAVCLDERTGRTLWSREWPASYLGIDYPSGPRATPTVDGEFVYILGAAGHLFCLRSRDGSVVWQRHYPTDFGSVIPGWGTANAPLVDGARLIVVPGGRPDAKVVALDKQTGKEIWRSLSGEQSEQGYSQPVLMNGKLVVFHAGGVSTLDPAAGRVLWEHKYQVTFNTPIATPVRWQNSVLVSSFFQGARMLDLADGELRWRGMSDKERNTDTFHALMAAPIVDGDYIYAVCNYGELRCLRASTGERVWQSQQATVEKARNVSAFLVANGRRTIIFNDRGELIFARLDPSGYHEISRTELIRPTSKPGSRRERNAVVWAHPAFANGHVIARNDEEVLRVSLELR
jgi:outer membrane protein assembly factor BamB